MSAKLLGWVPVLFLTGLLVGVPSGRADEKKKEELKPDQVVEEITDAYKLVEFGRKNSAPEALIAAASVLRSLKGAKLGKITEKPKIEDDDKSEEVKAKNFEEQADDLFEEARAMAAKKGVRGADGLIKAARDREYRDVVGGPRTINRTIGRHGTHTFEIYVFANQASTFGFRADFPMKISIVRSDNDNVIAAGITATGNVRHHFGGSPSGKVRVTVRITNVGNQAGSYSLYAS
jgi:hypothetical protein